MRSCAWDIWCRQARGAPLLSYSYPSLLLSLPSLALGCVDITVGRALHHITPAGCVRREQAQVSDAVMVYLHATMNRLTLLLGLYSVWTTAAPVAARAARARAREPAPLSASSLLGCAGAGAESPPPGLLLPLSAAAEPVSSVLTMAVPSSSCAKVTARRAAAARRKTRRNIFDGWYLRDGAEEVCIMEAHGSGGEALNM